MLQVVRDSLVCCGGAISHQVQGVAVNAYRCVHRYSFPFLVDRMWHAVPESFSACVFVLPLHNLLHLQLSLLYAIT